MTWDSEKHGKRFKIVVAEREREGSGVRKREEEGIEEERMEKK